MRPTKIVRADKVQGSASDKPANEKYTFQEANEDRDKTNAIIDYLPLHLSTDPDGDIVSTQLEGKDIGFIMGGGAVLQEDINFTKATADAFITMIDGNTLIPNIKYLLLPR